MSERITDELRKFMRGADGYELWCPRHRAELLEIADHIDAEHEKECREQYENGLNDGIDDGLDESFANVDDWLTQNEDAMAEHGWMRMPRDADDVPIRIGAAPRDANDVPICIGDVMEWPDGSTAEVVGIGLDTFFYVEDGNEKADWTVASTKRHHVPDTWERIIEDAIRGDGGSYGCLEERFDATVPALVARCRALAGEDE